MRYATMAERLAALAKANRAIEKIRGQSPKRRSYRTGITGHVMSVRAAGVPVEPSRHDVLRQAALTDERALLAAFHGLARRIPKHRVRAIVARVLEQRRQAGEL